LPVGSLLYGQGSGLLAAPFDAARLGLAGAPVSVPLDTYIDNWGAIPLDVSDTGTLVQAPNVRGGLGALVWVDRDGTVTRVLEDLHNYRSPRLSPDGKQVAFWYGSNANSDIWVLDLERRSSTRLTHEGFNAYPVWIPPQGSRIAFASNRGGHFDPYVIAADGSTPPEQLMKAEALRLMMSYTPDGRGGVFYEVNPNTLRDIWRWRADGEPEPLVVTPFNERSPVLSPDGHWFAYVSDESGQDEVYVSSFEGSRARYKVSIDGGVEPNWARDGRTLFYRSGESLMSVDVETTGRFVAGRPREILSGPYALDEFGTASYDVSPDGRRFLMVQQATSSTSESMEVVLNWFSELERLLAAK